MCVCLVLKSGNTSRESPKAAWNWSPQKAPVAFDPVYPPSLGPTLLSLISNLNSLEIGNLISVLTLSSGCISSVWKPVTQTALMPVSKSEFEMETLSWLTSPPLHIFSWPSTPRNEITPMQRGFSIIITSPALPSYTHTPFFASGKAAHFAESRHPRTLSGHLIPIRYFSLLSCSSLSWASCFFLSPRHLPHCWTLPRFLFHFLAVPSFSQSLSVYAVGVDHQQPALLSCVHPYVDSWHAVTDATKCYAAAVQECMKPSCKTRKWRIFLKHLIIHRACHYDVQVINTQMSTYHQSVQTSPNLKVPYQSPHPNVCKKIHFPIFVITSSQSCSFFGPCHFQIIQGLLQLDYCFGICGQHN